MNMWEIFLQLNAITTQYTPFFVNVDDERVGRKESGIFSL